MCRHTHTHILSRLVYYAVGSLINVYFRDDFAACLLQLQAKDAELSEQKRVNQQLLDEQQLNKTQVCISTSAVTVLTV